MGSEGQGQDIRDEPGRTLGLAREQGQEIVLDLKTGGEVVLSPENAPGPTMQVVVSALEQRSWRKFEFQESDRLTLPVTKGRFRFQIWIEAEESDSTIACWVSFPTGIPPARRAAVGELLHRVNCRDRHGAFEMDYKEGNVRYRRALTGEVSSPTPGQVSRMIDGALGTAEWLHDAVWRVGFGDVAAEVALKELEVQAARE